MTDFERMKQLFIDIKLKHEAVKSSNEKFSITIQEGEEDDTMICPSGYSDFYCAFLFDENGKFTGAHIAE